MGGWLSSLQGFKRPEILHPTIILRSVFILPQNTPIKLIHQLPPTDPSNNISRLALLLPRKTTYMLSHYLLANLHLSLSYHHPQILLTSFTKPKPPLPLPHILPIMLLQAMLQPLAFEHLLHQFLLFASYFLLLGFHLPHCILLLCLVPGLLLLKFRKFIHFLL